MSKNLIAKALLSLTLMASASAQAAQVTWVDWQSLTGWNGTSQTAYGTLVNGADVVDVWLTTTSPLYNWAPNGSPYWSGPAYTNGIVDNSPAGQDQVMLGAGGTVTVTFGQAIDTPLIAMNSWNNNHITFDKAITIDSQGCGYWGCGSAVNVTPTSFSGLGEFHGVISMAGAVTSFTMTHTTEYWHGLTIGVVDTQVPAPAAISFLGIGLLLLGVRRRRAI